MNKKKSPVASIKWPISQMFLIVILILLGSLTRVLPHPSNVTALLPMALFCGYIFKNTRFGFLIPLLMMVLTDFFIGFHSTILAVYLSVGISFILGKWALKTINPGLVFILSVLSSLQFYLLTNLSVWMHESLYPMTLQGLITCYTQGIPYLRYQLFGDLFYSVVIFGVYAFSKKKFSWPDQVSILNLKV